MSRVLAGAVTTMIMGAVVWIALGRPSPSTDPAAGSGSASRLHDSRLGGDGALTRARLDTATDRVESLLASVRAGDVDAYLGCFGGALRARLEREADELGRKAFAARLKSVGLARKSHAVFAPMQEADRPDSIRITVESAFEKALERQTFHLENAPGGWLICDVETARQQEPHYPLGSLANFEQPEGIPLAGARFEPPDAVKGSLESRSSAGRPRSSRMTTSHETR
jgi:hypothetical protein